MIIKLIVNRQVPRENPKNCFLKMINKLSNKMTHDFLLYSVCCSTIIRESSCSRRKEIMLSTTKTLYREWETLKLYGLWNVSIRFLFSEYKEYCKEKAERMSFAYNYGFQFSVFMRLLSVWLSGSLFPMPALSLFSSSWFVQF